MSMPPDNLPESGLRPTTDDDGAAVVPGPAMDPGQFTRLAVLFEFGLAAVAFLLGWFGVYDRTQPLNSIDSAIALQGLLWGTLALIPLLLYLAIIQNLAWRPLETLREFVDQWLRPILCELNLGQIFAVSILAGAGEELLFRWCIQGWISSAIGGNSGIIVGIALASLAFGLCHWVNAAYGITTALLGVYLGGLMVWTGTVIAPIITHALFDVVAIIVIAKTPTSRPGLAQSDDSQSDRSNDSARFEP